MTNTREDLSRYIYSDNDAAIAAVVELALSANTGTIVISDIDDSLLDSGAAFRSAINEALSTLEPDFTGITDEEVRDNGGRFCLTPSLIQLLATIDPQVSYDELVTPIYSDKELHEKMLPLDGIKDLLLAFSQNNIAVAAYLTARPEAIAEITAQSLASNSLPEAPIIHACNKVEIISQIAALLPPNFRIIVLDDIVDNLLPICELSETDDRIIPICVVSRHNQVTSQVLSQSGVFRGSLPEIALHLHELNKNAEFVQN
jgi:hypothetical protein